ncbi:MAG: helix-turn-helix domain-containing protein, partial [Myxococcota bacterium]
EDIPLLAGYFLRRYAEEFGRRVDGFGQAAMEQLQAYRWPGNVRELENEVQRLVIQLEDDPIVKPQHLSARVRDAEGSLIDRVKPKGALKEKIQALEMEILREALADHDGNKSQTAKTLGITREGLHKKLKNYGMT